MNTIVKNQVLSSPIEKKMAKEVSGTGEWAAQNANFITGCSHDCRYCYSKSMAIRFGRKTAESWKEEEVRQHSLRPKLSPKSGYTMFPSSHDIGPENMAYSLAFLGRLLENKHKVLVVTKPHLSVIKAICERFVDFKDHILFRFTIGSTNSETLLFWEPGAPVFDERLMALQYAYSQGFNTSVSAEPALDIKTELLIETLMPYVTDAIWVGLPNRLNVILKLNGSNDPDTLEQARTLRNSQTDAWVKDLYSKYSDNPKIKWKDSIKKIIGIERLTAKGLDV